MPANKKENNSGTVNEFIRTLDHPLKAAIEEVRSIIMNANNKMAERIKWNVPSFYYKEDFCAFNIRQQKFVHLVLIFPKGLICDSSGLLEGNYIDRRMAYFHSLTDIKSKKTALENVVNEWIKLIDE
ncbi:MAG TPA: DUF1801 domain-containing protein [Segetibacter sp.]|jgi:hypothetical protein